MDQDGEALAMSDEEAEFHRSLAGDRIPALETRTMALEPSEGHDAFAD